MKKEDKYLSKLGFPGQYPFTRGVQPTMYRGRNWTMRQYSGYGSAKETNERFKYLLKNGQTGLSVAFDLPTQMGYDSDSQMAKGEVGKVGVSINSMEDMRILFDGIPLDKVSTSMTINATATTLIAMYIALAEERGIERKVLRGTIQNDILKEYVARGTYIYPPEPSMRLIVDSFEYLSKETPLWNVISISGYHIREAGSTAVQEAAFTLANGREYVRAAVKAGLDVDKFAPKLSFFFNSHNDFLEEVAKFRAARRIWARIMKEEFNAKDPRSMMLRFHTQTAGCTLTQEQPHNNIVRVTIQALASFLGGTQSLHTNSFDEALCLPTEDAVRIALRTQQIIADESGVTNTVDPFAGSDEVEKLTDKTEEEVERYLKNVDEMGGAVKAIEKKYFQKEIEDSAYKYQRSIENDDITVVGVNKFRVEEKPYGKLLKHDKNLEKNQNKKVAAYRKKRNAKDTKSALRKLKEEAKGKGNLMPFIVDCVKKDSTLGEIASTLKEIFGQYRA